MSAPHYPSVARFRFGVSVAWRGERMARPRIVAQNAQGTRNEARRFPQTPQNDTYVGRAGAWNEAAKVSLLGADKEVVRPRQGSRGE